MNLENTLSKTNLVDSQVYVNSLESPTLLMQGELRQVVTANKKACELLNKNLEEIDGHSGGEVFDCINSFTEKGSR